ncbi:hypothetical protein N665_0382s0020 [Sinapis alba]|nr:hypothetical protein N665_0382s0020 [Sinapis alba]
MKVEFKVDIPNKTPKSHRLIFHLNKLIVLPVASSGIDALLLPNICTTHSRFNIPLKLSEETFCRIKPGTILAKLIHKTNLIILYEAPMTHKHAFKSPDRTLKDFQMRRTKQFSDWVLQVREGNAPTGGTNEYDEHHEQMVTIDKLLVEEVNEEPLKQVVQSTYGKLKILKPFHTYNTDRAILTPQDETVDEINAYTISQTDGVSREYLSSDSFEISETHSEQNETLYAVECLNSLNFSGLPSFKLTLKIEAPIMLIRNINQKEAYAMWKSSPVDMLVKEFHTTNRSPPTRNKSPIALQRLQFSIRLCYTMTINNIQGKSLKGVFPYLPKPIFTHSQLYVALSCVTTKNGLKVIQTKYLHLIKVKNVVYKKIFNDKHRTKVMR